MLNQDSSPYGKTNIADHSPTDRSSMLRFVEGNWGLGRMGNLALKAGCTMILTVSL